MSKSNNSNGFTLIELVVAMFIAGIVSIAIFTAFKSQQKSYLIQDQVAEMQQNLRAAMLMTSRDVRMAGFLSGDYVNSIETFNNYNDNGPDRVDLIYADADVTTSISDPMPSPSAIFKVDSTTGFLPGDLIIITDGTSGTLMQITHVNSSASTLQHNPSSAVNPPGGHNTFPPGGYGKGSKIYKLKYVSYDADSTDPDHPTMREDPDGPLGGGSYQPLADNIEDLQVVIIFADGDEANTYDDDTDGDLTNDYDDIRSVRISILARTDRPDPDFNGQRPAIEDHAGGAPDHYRRRLLTTLIKVRNLGL